MNTSAYATLCLAFGLMSLSLASAAPVISEFLADNETGLRDSDFEFSDWLELYNPDPDPVDLSGYFLTDDPLDLTKWEIPATTTLGANSFLVIFASNKDRAVAGEELHTNFRLDDAGEYLALVAEDGVTIVHDYAPEFPVQFDDSSFGLEQTANSFEETLVQDDAACRAHVPTNGALANTWIGTAFDDSTWTAGTLGVGYERSTGYEGLLGVDVEQAMFNQQTSVFIRIPFTLTDADQISALDLEMQYDDGFAVYLNGWPVLYVNGSSTPPQWDSTAVNERLDADALDFQTFSLNSQVNRLLEGENILAIHGLNLTAADDDLLIRPRLRATRITSYTLGDTAYFVDPSPGGPNGLQEELPTAEVVLSDESKTFTTSFQVTLSSAFPEQTIRYTLNGSVPVLSSPSYTAPITITNTTQLRARVFGANNAAGPLAMATYIRLTGSITGFSSNLPIVIIDTFGRGDPGGSVNLDGFWAIIEPDADTNERAEMLDEFQIATRCGLRRRGSSSFGWPKYAMAVESQNELGDDKGIKPLGLPRESDWVLSGRYEFDRALMRNPLMYRLSNETGEYAVRTRFVEVFRNTNGGNLDYNSDYVGVYTFMEKIKRDDDRVDVAPIDVRRDLRLPNVSGGYMFKKDRTDNDDTNETFAGARMGNFVWVEPDGDEVNPRQKNWLEAHIREVDAALYSASWTNASTNKHFTEYLDQDSWLRHHWLNTLAKNVDGFRLSGYYYKHRDGTNDGKIGAGPIWDFDRTMNPSSDGRASASNFWDGTGDSSKTWDDGRYPWWGRALDNVDFRQAHADLWQELRLTTFSTLNIESIINEFAAAIDFRDPSNVNAGFQRTPAARNFAKWSNKAPRGGSHRAEVITLKTWLRGRVRWIDQQFVAQPRFATAPGLVLSGSEVSLTPTTTGSTIYYTTDGTDPRLPGGGVSSSATTTLPITVNSSTVITARAFLAAKPATVDSLTQWSQWSGPVQGTYLVGPLADSTNLAITEVHYAPLPAATPAEEALSTDPSDFEFLEMMNISATDTIDLTDAHFEAGIEFTFTGSAITSLAPGERVLIVCNQAAFEERYGPPHSGRIAGEFAPTRLDNAGERLHLVNGLGETIADFTYNDKIPWPSEAGFAGYSMVLKAISMPNPDYSDPLSWRSSGLLGGNPNATDSTQLVGDPESDDDEDRLNKLLEHALGKSDADPTDGGDLFSTAFLPVEVNGATDSYLTITHRRNLRADDVMVLPEFAFNLQNWFGGPVFFPIVSEVNQGDGTSLVTRRVIWPHDLETYPQVYVRLKATKLQ